MGNTYKNTKTEGHNHSKATQHEEYACLDCGAIMSKNEYNKYDGVCENCR